MTFLVLAKQYAGSPEQEVYRTSDAENASCFAESHFINRHPQSVRAVVRVGGHIQTLKDQRGREFSWQRI